MINEKEPIAIIGIGCRFPGAQNPEAFWQLLCDGKEAISELPIARRDDGWLDFPELTATNQPNIRMGGFLEDVDRFDPLFFGIAPVEVPSMDPQQRLLLEVTWEALEDAGQIPGDLAGTQTGVFIGMLGLDYGQFVWKDGTIDPYATTGTSHCIAANRISYLLNLNGPSLVVDTACSSSLVALHLACESIRRGESTTALAGGVNLVLVPNPTASVAKAGLFSAAGHCKTFDAEADGYVRSDGVGVVVLKPLSQAMADGNCIYAVIRGSAINHNGRSNGLMAPNPRAQEVVLREAYRQAGISPSRIQYVEAQGTGSKLGDAMELKALGAVLAEGRPPGSYCAVGSVKTNIGHTEAASGMAGLIKVALSLKHRQIPPSLHFHQPNPLIPFDSLPLRVQQTLEPWPEGDGAAVAGVSAFAFGGANAHVVLEGMPATPKVELKVENGCDRPLHILTLSAKTPAALQELANRYLEFLTNHPEISIADFCFTANTGRTHFNHRLAIVGNSITQFQKALKAFIAGKESLNLVSGSVKKGKRPKIAFMFTNHLSQYHNMGRELYETQPTFRQAFDRCDEILRSYLSKSIAELLYVNEGENLNFLNETAYSQPALFVLEYALCELWKSWGIEPALVMGNSLGEYAAACAAEILSLEDGLKLVSALGSLTEQLPRNFKLRGVTAKEEKVAAAIAPYKGKIWSLYEGGDINLIAGFPDAMEVVIASLEAEGIETRDVISNYTYGFQTEYMKSILPDLQRVANELTYSQSKIDFISTVTGDRIAEVMTAEYWSTNILEPVKFSTALKTAAQQGCEIFVEIGPKTFSIDMGITCLPTTEMTWLPSLRENKSNCEQMLKSLAKLYVKGVSIDWFGFEGEYRRHRLSIPTYPFQRDRYWFEPASTEGEKVGIFLSSEISRSPLVDLFNTGDVGELTRQLETTANLSADELKLLPKLLELLVAKPKESSREMRDRTEELPPVSQQELPLHNSGADSFTPKSAAETREELVADIFGIAQQLNVTAVGDRPRLLLGYLQIQVAKTLGISAAQLDEQQHLTELGLDSLMAMELTHRLKTELGVDLSAIEFMGDTTLAEIATKIANGLPTKVKPSSLNQFPFLQNQSFKSQTIVTMQPEGNKRPLFWMHPVAGVVFPYRELALILGKKRPIYGVQAVGIDNSEEPLTTIESMAARYIQDIRAIQPEGPYYLGGWSFGALIAFEMAVQLQRAGQTVDLLALLDQPPNSTREINNFWYACKFMVTTAMPSIWPYVGDFLNLPTAGNNKQQLEQLAIRFVQLQGLELRIPAALRLMRVTLANFQAFVNYKTPTYSSKVSLFAITEKGEKNNYSRDYGWKNFAKEVELYSVTGHHLNLLRPPYVQDLAKKLQVCLDKLS